MRNRNWVKFRMNIPINVPYLGKEEKNAVLSVLKEGSLTSSSLNGGENVVEFEKQVTKFVKSKYAIAVN